MKLKVSKVARNVLLTLGAAFGIGAIVFWYESSLRLSQYLTGWILLLILIFLALFNLRKKLPFLPLGTAESWLQWHLYIGWLSMFIFVLHGGNHWPGSPLGWSIFLLYLGAALSGVVGIFISRNFAGRLTTRGGEVIYERIPELRRKLRERAEALVERSVSESNMSTIGDFYTNRLLEFFTFSKNQMRHLLDSRAHWARMEAEMNGMDRYLSDVERGYFAELRELVKMKEDLDYHESLQSALKYWLFFHIPASVALLILVFAHVLLAYAFAGRVP